MAEYRTITDAEVDPDAPLTSSLGYAWRDNPIAIAEGAPGAPRIFRGAISPPVVGGYSILQQTVTAGPSSVSSSDAISCFVPGTVRFNISGLSLASPNGEAWIRRSRRGGTYSNLTQVTSNGNYDVPVIVGDRLTLRLSGGVESSSADVNITIGDNSVGIAVI